MKYYGFESMRLIGTSQFALDNYLNCINIIKYNIFNTVEVIK